MLTPREIDALQPSKKIIKRGLGEGLILVVERLDRGGGKSFVGTKRFPRGRKGKEKNIHLGQYKKDISLKNAREEWRKIKKWSDENNLPVNKFNHHNDPFQNPSKSKTLIDAIRLFDTKHHCKVRTKEGYMNQLNQVKKVIDEETPLLLLEWGRGGREKVMKMIKTMEDRKAYDHAKKTQRVLRQVFDYAIAEGWMERGENPATRDRIQERPHKPKHHPTIPWKEVPSLLDAINRNECKGSLESDLAVKLLLMTFLRVGAIVRLQFDWIEVVDGIECFVIPGSTAGLKRRLGVNDDVPHYVPLTDEMKRVIELLSRWNGHQKYLFHSPRAKKYPHLCPDAPNNHLKNLGYKGVLRAHGWRSVPLTTGQEVLGIDPQIIRRQMGHLIGDKVQRSYETHLHFLKERKDFLDKWCDALVNQGLKI